MSCSGAVGGRRRPSLATRVQLLHQTGGSIKTSFEGSAKASRGIKLGQSDMVWISDLYIVIAFPQRLYFFMSSLSPHFLQLFFPICEGRHWFDFAVDFQYRLFAFLDSLYDMNSDFHARIKDPMVRKFCIYTSYVVVFLTCSFSINFLFSMWSFFAGFNFCS